MKRALKRLFRGVTACTIAGIAIYMENDPLFIIIAPVLNATFKYMRVKWGIKYLPL